MTEYVTSADMRARRAKQNAIQYRVEAALFHVAYASMRALGVEVASALGGAAFKALGPLVATKYTRRAKARLRRAFPDLSEQDVDRTIRDVWENLGRTCAEFAHLDKFHPFKDGGHIDVEGLEYIDIAKERPVIFVSGHFANWEVASITLFQNGLEYCAGYRPANNIFIDKDILRIRGNVMSSELAPKGAEGMRKMMSALKKGWSLAMFTDQKLNDGVAAPFLGHDAMTTPAPARFSLKYGAPIIPIAIERIDGVEHRVRAYPPMDFKPSGDTDADVLALTTQINEFLAERIKEKPGQWLWLHNRWPSDR